MLLNESDIKAFAQLSLRLSFDDMSPTATGSVDAIYLPGLSSGMIASCDLFGLIASAKHGSTCEKLRVTYNGNTQDDALRTGWAGRENYEEEFLKRGVPQMSLLPTAPAFHTRSECDEFIALSKLHNFKTAKIATVLYHWPRVMLCLVAAMVKYDHRMKIHFLRPVSVNWNQEMVGSQGTLKDSSFLVETGNDLERFCGYLEKGRAEEGTAWIQAWGAPLPKVMEYLSWRDDPFSTP